MCSLNASGGEACGDKNCMGGARSPKVSDGTFTSKLKATRHLHQNSEF